jgi:hypothetical protein
VVYCIDDSRGKPVDSAHLADQGTHNWIRALALQAILTTTIQSATYKIIHTDQLSGTAPESSAVAQKSPPKWSRSDVLAAVYRLHLSAWGRSCPFRELFRLPDVTHCYDCKATPSVDSNNCIEKEKGVIFEEKNKPFAPWSTINSSSTILRITVDHIFLGLTLCPPARLSHSCTIIVRAGI